MNSTVMKLLVLAIAIPAIVSTVWGSEGDTLWTRYYGGDFNQVANAACSTGDGGCLVAGHTQHSYTDDWDMYAVRLTASGDTLWTHDYGITDYYEEARDVCPSGDGGFMLAGNTNAYTPTWADMYLMKINANGDTAWSEHYGGLYAEVAYSICPTGEGGFLLTGKTDSFIPPGGGLYLVRVDASGGVIWSFAYGGESGIAYDAVATLDGGFVVVGYLWTASNGEDAYIFKVNSAGEMVWNLQCGGSEDDFATAICPAGDGGYMVAGYTGSFGAGSWDVYLIKVDASGDTVWTRTYGGTSFEEAWGVIPSNDGNYLLAGHTGQTTTTYTDMLLVKLDPAGNQLWWKTYGGDNEDQAAALCASDDGHYYLAGRSISFTWPYLDAYVVKVDGTASAVEPGLPRPGSSSFNLYPCHPNPFNPSTVISFELRAASFVTLEVFDVNGRMVSGSGTTPTTDGRGQWFPAGIHQITFDGSNLPSGLYFAKLTAGENIDVQKLVLLK